MVIFEQVGRMKEKKKITLRGKKKDFCERTKKKNFSQNCDFFYFCFKTKQKHFYKKKKKWEIVVVRVYHFIFNVV